MTRSFEITVTVDSLYELEATIDHKEYDQRGGSYYAATETVKHTFQDFDKAYEWVMTNPKAEIKSFVRLENKLAELKKSINQGLTDAKT